MELHHRAGGYEERAGVVKVISFQTLTERTRVGIDDLGDPGVDATVRRTRSARARGVGQSLPQVTLVAVVEPLQPVIDRPAADAQGFSDLLDRLALVEP